MPSVSRITGVLAISLVATACEDLAVTPSVTAPPTNALLLPTRPSSSSSPSPSSTRKQQSTSSPVIVPDVPPPPPQVRLDARTYEVQGALAADLPPSILDALDVAFLGRLDIFAHASPGSRIHAFAEDSKLSALVVDTPTIRLHAIRVDAPDGKSRWYDELGRRSDTGVFLGRPLALSRITSRYGTRLHPITGDVRTHRGIDYGAATGTPVVAIADGTVTTRATDASSGNWLKLDHTGRQSFYLHLDDFAEGIAQGAKVQQGQVIGFVGSTGKSTGPHLHFETRMGPVSIDPLQMLPAPTEVLTQHERPAFLARLRRLQEATPSRR